MANKKEFKKYAEVLKVSEELGLVFGWASVSSENGIPYFDTQGENATEEGILKAATDFMQNSRAVKEMHEGVDVGLVVFAFPLIEEVKKAFDIGCNKSGFAIAVKPDQTTFDKFKSGEYTGFSIGGEYGECEEVE